MAPTKTPEERATVDLRIAKSTQTRTRILETATERFLIDGYSSTSLEAVAAEAKVTKPTVYSHFKSKQGLFDAVIQECAAHRLQELASFLEPSGDPRNDLVQLGDLLMSRVLGKDSVRWDRLAAAESISHPEIGEAFYKAGPGAVLKRLAEYFDLQTKAGRLKVDDSLMAAEMFCGMLLTLDVLRSQIGQPVSSIAKRKKRCRSAVDAFMNTFGASS